MGQESDDEAGGGGTGGARDAHAPYVKETFQLSASHAWKASPGFSILVIDAGAVRFEYPQGWHVVPKGRQLTIHDRLPPDDEGRIQITVFRLPRLESGSWDELPLDELLRGAINDSNHKGRKRRARKSAASTTVHDVTAVRRPDLEYAWAEQSSPDRENGRPVYTRQMMARARGVQPLVTFDYYASRADEYRPVWQHLVDTLRLGAPVSLQGDASN